MEATILTKFILPMALFIIMLGMGLSLTISDFAGIKNSPKSLILGISFQMILLPLIAFAVVNATGLESKLGLGLMVVALCPGGVTSNLYTLLSKGNIALSISLTAIVSILAPFTIPILFAFLMDYFGEEGKTVDISVLKTILSLMVITLVPVSIGMFLKSRKEHLAGKAAKPVRYLSLGLLFIIILGICLQNADNLPTLFAQTGLSGGLLNISAMLIAFFGASLFGLNLKDRKTICMEVGLQNGTTALFITSTLLQDPILSMPAATYSLIMFATGSIAATFFSR